MKETGTWCLALCLCAGGVSAMSSGAESPTVLTPSVAHVRDAAYIYYNMATGERVVTLPWDAQTSGADTGESVLLWGTTGDSQCADAGYTTQFFYGVDDNSPTSMGGAPTSLATGATVIDFGDIAKDTVVDCVHIEWVTGHADVDSDSDGIGDGVVGLGGTWTYNDADNGRMVDYYSTRLPLVSFTLSDLPGNTFGEGFAAGYNVDIDLAGAFSGTSLTFEIGDSDGDLQGAAFGNSNVDTNSDGIGDGVSVSNADRNFDGLPDSDIDGDGLFDWSWYVRFYQPGTFDFDGDGIIDGDPADGFAPIGISFGFPIGGFLVDNGDGTSGIEVDGDIPGAATGVEDRFALLTPDGLFAGIFNFGGYSCTGDPLPDGDGYTPFATFVQELLGPGEVICDADINQDGELNFFDVSQFLQEYNAGGDYNHDGVTNFFDVSMFLSDYSSGCP